MVQCAHELKANWREIGFLDLLWVREQSYALKDSMCKFSMGRNREYEDTIVQVSVRFLLTERFPIR